MNQERENTLGKMENDIKEEIPDKENTKNENGGTKPAAKKIQNKNPPKNLSAENNTQNSNIGKAKSKNFNKLRK
jgi:hypothetical protein